MMQISFVENMPAYFVYLNLFNLLRADSTKIANWSSRFYLDQLSTEFVIIFEKELIMFSKHIIEELSKLI